MGGDADGGPSLIAGLPGRGADQPLHAELTSGTLLLAISGPGVVAVPLSARGMRCISQRFMISQVWQPAGGGGGGGWGGGGGGGFAPRRHPLPPPTPVGIFLRL